MPGNPARGLRSQPDVVNWEMAFWNMLVQRRSAYIPACLWVIGLLCAPAATSNAATYYVANTNGAASDTNAGTLASPWLTIGHAAATAVAGDIVRVEAGTYNERVEINTTGTNGAWINYVADGRAICRGFDLFAVNYIRIVGFEITHTNIVSGSAYTRGILMSGVCSHIDIIDNWIHNVQDSCILACPGSTPTWITIRGNAFRYPGMVVGIYSNSAPPTIAGIWVTPHHWLIEYNTTSNACDYFDVFGTNLIIRNNFTHDYRDWYYTNAPGSNHSDQFQCGSDGVAVGTRYHIIERNFCGDSAEANSHFGIWQDTVQAGDTNILLRGNVGFNFGNGACGAISTKNFRAYNNTFFQITNGNAFVVYKYSSSSDCPMNPMLVNTIIDAMGATSTSIYFDPCIINFISLNNLGFECPFDSSFIVTNDPMFVSPNTPIRDFHLQSGSPAIGVGTNVVWIRSPNGSGTSFTVNDSQLQCDGWGMVDGDTITVGGTTTVITNISWGDNTVRVRNSVTWTNGQAVYWGKQSTVDIGALPYGSKALTGATISQSGNTYTVTTTGDARGVWFYVDGIPTIWVPSPPFTSTITNGTVTAKAYALYAQANPVVTATNAVATAVAPPGVLRVASP